MVGKAGLVSDSLTLQDVVLDLGTTKSRSQRPDLISQVMDEAGSCFSLLRLPYYSWHIVFTCLVSHLTADANIRSQLVIHYPLN